MLQSYKYNTFIKEKSIGKESIYTNGVEHCVTNDVG